MRKLRVALLGRFYVRSELGPIELQTSAAGLMAYLALSHGRPLARARVAGALWPDLSDARARANLSTVTWRLRQALNGHGYSNVVRSSMESVALDPEACDIDTQNFVRNSPGPGSYALSLEALAQAVRALELYRGDLLEDWDVEWCQLEREELRQRHLHTMRAVAEGFERRGRYDLALQHVRKAVRTDPLDEAAQRILIRSLYRNGDRAAAVDQFNRFADLARSELGVEPDEATIALLNEIKRLPSSRRSSATAKPRDCSLIRPEIVPLVGRVAERQQASVLLDDALAASGGALLVVGEAGVGKSKLSSWIMEEWAARGGAIAQGRCLEFDEPIPYQPLLDALGSYLDGRDLSEFVRRDDSTRHVPTIEGSLGTNAGVDANPASLWPVGKLQLFNWLKAGLEDATRRRPVLLVIEDLQWADAGSVDFLTYLLDRAKSMSLVVVMTSRPAGNRVNHALDVERLSRYSTAVLRLGPLTEEETNTLVRSLLEASETPAELASWLYVETEGNPLFVIETLRLLEQKADLSLDAQNRIRYSNDIVHFRSRLSIPEGVRTALQQRLRLINPPSLRMAGIASVLGRSFDEELLRMTAGTGENRLSRAVGDLLGAGIFERENAGYRFTHDKIRAYCYESLSVGVRRIYHARAAAALAQVPDVPIHRLAWHQLCAGHWHLAAASWSRAGDQAREIHAYEEALRAYRHAISCLKKDETSDDEAKDLGEIGLLIKSDEMLSVLGRPMERREILEQIGVLCGKTLRAPLQAVWLIRRALLEEHVGNFVLASNLASRAWFIARSDKDRTLEIEALRVMAWALNRAGRHRRSLKISRLALKKMGDADSLTKITTLWQAASACIALCDYAAASSYLQLARGASNRSGDTREYPLILTAEAVICRMTGNPQTSRASLLKALQLASEAGARITGARARIHLTTLDALEGKLGDALCGLRRASVESRLASYTRTHVSCLNEVAHSIGRIMGNYSWARHAIALALSLFEPADSLYLSTMLLSSRAQLLLDEGRLPDALAAVNEVLQQFKSEQPSGDHYQESLVIRGAIWLQMGNLGNALVDLEAARDLQERNGYRVLLSDTLTYLALTHAGLGESNRALSTSEEAVRVLTEIGYANYQPQRIFWHHYLILEMFDRSPRLQYLERAVEFIETQASSLSRAQARRLRQEVRLNREILVAWERHRQPLQQTAGALSS